MNKQLVDYIGSLNPSLDVLGQWLFVGNAKTAQKSMMQGSDMDSRQITRHRGWRNYRRVWHHVILPRIDDVLMFTFVRNSWDRVVSAVHYVQQRHRMYSGRTFQDIIKRELAVHGTDINQHFRLQAPSFLFRGEPIPNMFVGRFETLCEDWATIANRLGVQKELPHRNKSNHKPYTDYYDDECVEIVANIYAEEIGTLGYEFGK